jgi:2-iminoacetate synthase
MENEMRKNRKGFIAADSIRRSLEEGKRRTPEEIRDGLAKAAAGEGLDPREAAALLQIEEEPLLAEMFRTARAVKEKIYGKRLVLFAPLYLGNHCVNNCLYCGFRRDNPRIARKRLNPEEIRVQVSRLEDQGHKRLLLECGESPLADMEFVEEAIGTVYGTRNGRGEIRRVNVNIAATTAENYRRLKAAKIGTYQLFQETYHRPTYEALHEGPKRDYERQLFAHDRAMEAGLDDVGLGVLFGLYDFKFEVLALLHHARHLEEAFGVGPHTISVPRWRPAAGVDFAPPRPTADEDFKKLVAVLRLAVPYTGMIISTRETVEMRSEAFGLGITQTSAGSRTSPGGYGSRADGKGEETEQFRVADPRSPDAVVRSICDLGYLPSFCTACYRRGRTGKAFMDLAKPGDIQGLCQPNALLTFQEYLEDYSAEETRKVGAGQIQKHLQEIADPELRRKTESRLKEIANGKRDLFF